MPFSEKMKAAQKAAKLNNCQLARLSGVPYRTISNYRGRSIVNIPPENKEKIARALKLSPALFDDAVPDDVFLHALSLPHTQHGDFTPPAQGSKQQLTLESLGLSNRALRDLKNAGFHTVEDITSRTVSELLKMTGDDRNGVGNLLLRLDDAGLRCAGCPEEAFPRIRGNLDLILRSAAYRNSQEQKAVIVNPQKAWV